MTVSMPTWSATARAARSLSPVSRIGVSPRVRRSAIAAALVGLIGVGDDDRGADGAVPADEHRGVAGVLGGGLGVGELGGEGHGPVGEEPFAAGDDAVAVDDALHAEAFEVGEVFDRGQRADAVAGAGGDGLGDGVLGGVLERAGEAQHLVGVDAVDRDDVDERHAAGGDGAGLVEDDGVDLAGRLEDLRALDEDAELRAAAGADEQSGGGGEAEGAGAGDDEDGDGGGERGGGGLAGAEPEAEGADGEGDDDGDEHGGDLVGEPLDRGLAVLGVGDEPGDLGEGGVGADPGGPHDEAAAGVDGGAGDGVAGADFDGDGFAGEQRRVDGGGAFLDDAVGGDLLAGPDDEPVADGELADRDADLVAVAEDGDVLGAQVEQGAQGGTGGALGAGFEVAAGEDEHDDDAGDLEVQLVCAGAPLEGEREAHLHARHPGFTARTGRRRSSRTRRGCRRR